MSPSEKVEEASNLKATADSAFRESNLELALDKWLEAARMLEDVVNPDLPPADGEETPGVIEAATRCYSNCSLACLKASRWKEAIDHAEKAIERHAATAGFKAHFRAAQAGRHLGQLERAKQHLDASLRLSPGSAALLQEQVELKKAIALVKAKKKKAYGGMFSSKGR